MLRHTEAFEHRCLSTQKHLPRGALTYTLLYTQKLLGTDCFSENHRSFDTEKPLHRESFTHRSFYTHKLFHRSFYTEKLLTHRSFYTQTPLHTEACTRRGFCAQKLLHREAFTHRRFPTEKAIPQSSSYTLNKPKEYPQQQGSSGRAIFGLSCPSPRVTITHIDDLLLVYQVSENRPVSFDSATWKWKIGDQIAGPENGV